MKEVQRSCLGVVALAILFGPCGSVLLAQVVVPKGPVKSGPGGTVTYSLLPIKTYHLKNLTPAEKERVEICKRINEITTGMYADQMDGIYDVKKVKELQELVAKLPGGGPPEEKRSFLGKIFRPKRK